MCIVRVSFFAIALLLVQHPAWAEDAEDTCDPYPDVPVHVTPVFEEPTYDYSVNINALQVLSRSGHAGIREGMTLGLTHYQPILDIATTTRTVEMPDGTTCARIDHVDVEIGYKDVTVYVANEVPQDSCGFNEILGHEAKHIAVNRAILDAYTPFIEEKLKDYLKLNGVFREENYGYAVTLVRDKMKEILSQIATQLTNDNTERQREVDTPQEYHRVSVSCHGQLQAVMAQFMKTGQ